MTIIGQAEKYTFARWLGDLAVPNGDGLTLVDKTNPDTSVTSDCVLNLGEMR